MMQRVAIASSDVIGWTPDGRLIVQMPVLPVGQGLAGQQTRPGQGLAGQTRLGQGPRPAPIRRASTGIYYSYSVCLVLYSSLLRSIHY